MSLRSILFGAECHECTAFGVNCTQSGVLLEDQNNPAGKSVIHVGNRGFVCREIIGECPVVLGEVNNQKMAEDIKAVVEEIKSFIVQPGI